MECNKISENQEIDIVEIAKKLYDGKKIILKYCSIAFFIGLIVSLSIPKEYTTTVTLASEVTKSTSSSSMVALASMAGINIGSNNSRDALSPLVYPEIVSSTSFIVDMFDIPVKSKDGEINTTLSKYINEYQKKPWWSSIFSAPFKLVAFLKSLFSDNTEKSIKNKLNPFCLTNEEMGIVNAIKKSFSVTVDKKTAIITIGVTMQDPLISACIADSVMNRLQNHITKYRTSKAKIDLEFSQNLYNTSKEEYYRAQQEYADYVDKNQNITLLSVQTKQQRLLNDMQLAYGIYTQNAQQLQLAKAKVQENTPVYAVIEPATVPLSATKPSKLMTVGAFVFLSIILSCSWIIFGKNFISKLRK